MDSWLYISGWQKNHADFLPVLWKVLHFLEFCLSKMMTWHFQLREFWFSQWFDAIQQNSWVVVSNIFIFSPIWGRWTHFDEHIFHRGWNHQLDSVDIPQNRWIVLFGSQQLPRSCYGLGIRWSLYRFPGSNVLQLLGAFFLFCIHPPRST